MCLICLGLATEKETLSAFGVIIVVSEVVFHYSIAKTWKNIYQSIFTSNSFLINWNNCNGVENDTFGI